MDATAAKSAAVTQGDAHAEPVKLLRRIGSTTIEVTVHFSKESNETMADITRRLIFRSVERGDFNEKVSVANVVSLASPEREVKKCA